MKWYRIDESAEITGLGRIQMDDDIVKVFKPDGKCVFSGLFDDCPYKNDDLEYDKLTKTYKCYNPNNPNDFRIIALVAEA